MRRSRIGLSIMLLESRREAIIALATEGDRLGDHGFFMPEAWGYDMTVMLAEAAARTTQITLGTGILGIWNRSAATIAMAAATLHAMSSGRFVLGKADATQTRNSRVAANALTQGSSPAQRSLDYEQLQPCGA